MERLWNWALSRFLCLLADAHRHFGNEYGNRREYQAAVGNYTRAMRLDPAYTQAYFSRGVLYWREFGLHHQAIDDLTRVLELDPSYAVAYLNRGLAHKMLGQYDRAISDFEQYLEEGDDEFWLEAARRQLAELRDDPADSTAA